MMMIKVGVIKFFFFFCPYYQNHDVDIIFIHTIIIIVIIVINVFAIIIIVIINIIAIGSVDGLLSYFPVVFRYTKKFSRKLLIATIWENMKDIKPTTGWNAEEDELHALCTRGRSENHLLEKIAPQRDPVLATAPLRPQRKTSIPHLNTARWIANH